jgi:hypothetical protein
MTGCTTPPASPNQPASDACTGAVVITGTLQDSLTHQPVSQGWAVLESGSELSVTPAYNFYPAQKVATDAQGGFRLCAQTLASPSALVAVALDSAGMAYPPFVAPVSATTSFGAIPMGGCAGVCAFPGEQQTSAPATITGAITTTPIAKTGTVVPQDAMPALDGSKAANGDSNLWSLAIPNFNASQANTFSTASGACAGTVPFCAAYTFALPSQNPVRLVNGGYVQGVGAPIYSIYAVPDGSPSCIPSSVLTILQQDGSSLLTANPGSQITASTLAFSLCQ